MYLIIVALGQCLAYVGLFYLFPYFFGYKQKKIKKQSVHSLIGIVAFSFLIYLINDKIPSAALANRIEHAFGGGFLSFIICFLAAKNARLPIKKFQFFFFSFLIVTTLGVINEICEFLLQHFTPFIFGDKSFANNIEDTWLDLVSNTIGALLAIAALLPFIKRKHV